MNSTPLAAIPSVFFPKFLFTLLVVHVFPRNHFGYGTKLTVLPLKLDAALPGEETPKICSLHTITIGSSSKLKNLKFRERKKKLRREPLHLLLRFAGRGDPSTCR